MTVVSSRSSKLDSLGRSSPYVRDIRSPGKREAELAPTGRRPLIALRRSSRSGVQTLLRGTTETNGAKYEGHNTSIATLVQMGTALARLSDAALEIKHNRIAAIAAHESCGFAFPNAYADALAYGAEAPIRAIF